MVPRRPAFRPASMSLCMSPMIQERERSSSISRAAFWSMPGPGLRSWCSMMVRSEVVGAAGPPVALGLLERLNRSDVLMIALPQPAIHSAHKRRQHVEAQIKTVHVGHLMIGRGAKSIDTAVG